jgi:hypothetical protein
LPNDPYSQRFADNKMVLKSKSALSKYINEEKESIDFDEISSVKLREDLHIIQREGGIIPDLSMSHAEMSYTSSKCEEDKLLD